VNITAKIGDIAFVIPVSEEVTSVCANGTMTTGIMFEQSPIRKIQPKTDLSRGIEIFL
jgi:hypothetical protein